MHGSDHLLGYIVHRYVSDQNKPLATDPDISTKATKSLAEGILMSLYPDHPSEYILDPGSTWRLIIVVSVIAFLLSTGYRIVLLSTGYRIILLSTGYRIILLSTGYIIILLLERSTSPTIHTFIPRCCHLLYLLREPKHLPSTSVSPLSFIGGLWPRPSTSLNRYSIASSLQKLAQWTDTFV